MLVCSSLCLGRREESDPFPRYISLQHYPPPVKTPARLWERRTLPAHGSSVITFSPLFLLLFFSLVLSCIFIFTLGNASLFGRTHAHAAFLEEKSKKEIFENSTTGERAWREPERFI